jgi:hypothetical protein
LEALVKLLGARASFLFRVFLKSLELIFAVFLGLTVHEHALVVLGLTLRLEEAAEMQLCTWCSTE